MTYTPQNFHTDRKKVHVIALTGGPCGGKTTIMNELYAQEPKRWLRVPESAPLLFSAGLRAGESGFQRAVVELQKQLEDVVNSLAGEGQVMVCHRGTLDALAYWMRMGWEEEEFFQATGMARGEHHRRYLGVLHLRTVARGAREHYVRWPKAHRPETEEEAAEVDVLCERAWRGHPRYCCIENRPQGWAQKQQDVREAIEQLLATAGEETR